MIIKITIGKFAYAYAFVRALCETNLEMEFKIFQI